LIQTGSDYPKNDYLQLGSTSYSYLPIDDCHLLNFLSMLEEADPTPQHEYEQVAAVGPPGL